MSYLMPSSSSLLLLVPEIICADLHSDIFLTLHCAYLKDLLLRHLLKEDTGITFVCLSVCLSIQPSICLSVSQSATLPVSWLASPGDTCVPWNALASVNDFFSERIERTCT